MTTHKSDVWSACATMMNVLIGKAVNKDAREQVRIRMIGITQHVCNLATYTHMYPLD